MDLPRPLLSLAIEPRTQADREKLTEGLQKLSIEDPSLRVRVDSHNGVILGAAGELQLEIAIERLHREFGVNAMLGRPQVFYKEAITRPADGETKYSRLIGRRGDYAHVKLRLFPREPDSGYIFVNRNVGGAIPDKYVQPVDEGIREALARGVLAGYPIEDVQVELYDGSYHELDSSEMAFKIAGSMAFQDAANKAGPVVLEPIMRLEVLAPKEYASGVSDNLLRRRAVIQSKDERNGRQVIQASVPLSEMFGYATDLRSVTNGRATFSMRFERWEP